MSKVAAWIEAVVSPLSRARQRLRREPHDITTAEGRAQERDRRAADSVKKAT